MQEVDGRSIVPPIMQKKKKKERKKRDRAKKNKEKIRNQNIKQ